MTDAKQLTLALGGRWYGSYATCACPVCQPERRRDQSALTLAYGNDGRLLTDCKKSGCDFRDILAAAGVAPGSYTQPDPAVIARRASEELAQTEKRSRQALAVWDEALPIGGTVAERYLRNRGIDCDLPGTLRYHPSCWHGPTTQRYPAMIGRVQGCDHTAIHRTFLRPDGAGKACIEPSKLMLGATAGGAVRLSGGPGPLLIGEGIESTLSAFILLGDMTATVWAALSTSGLRGLHLPRLGRLGRLGTVRASLIVAVDGEKAGRDAGRDLAERACGLGWLVGIMDPGDATDWNDRLLGKAANHGYA